MGVTILEVTVLAILGATFAGGIWAFSGWLRRRNLKISITLMGLAIYLVVSFLVIAPHYAATPTGEVVEYTTTTTVPLQNGSTITVNATVTRPVLRENPAPAAYAGLVAAASLALLAIAFVFLVAEAVGWRLA